MLNSDKIIQIKMLKGNGLELPVDKSLKKFSDEIGKARSLIDDRIKKLSYDIDESGNRVILSAGEHSLYRIVHNGKKLVLTAGKKKTEQEKAKEREAEMQALLRGDLAKIGAGNTKPLQILWEIEPLLSTLSNMQQKGGDASSIRGKTGDALAELLLDELARTLRDKDSKNISSDYRFKKLLEHPAIQYRVSHLYDKEIDIRFELVKNLANKMNPENFASFVKDVCRKLDGILEEAIKQEVCNIEPESSHKTIEEICESLLSVRNQAKCTSKNSSAEYYTFAFPYGEKSKESISKMRYLVADKKEKAEESWQEEVQKAYNDYLVSRMEECGDDQTFETYFLELKRYFGDPRKFRVNDKPRQYD